MEETEEAVRKMMTFAGLETMSQTDKDDCVRTEPAPVPAPPFILCQHRPPGAQDSEIT